jgi:hypothetical protein
MAFFVPLEGWLHDCFGDEAPARDRAVLAARSMASKWVQA